MLAGGFLPLLLTVLNTSIAHSVKYLYLSLHTGGASESSPYSPYEDDDVFYPGN